MNRFVKDKNGSRFRSQSGGAGFNRFRSKSGRTGFSKDRSRLRSQSGGAGFNRYRSKSGGAGFSKDRTGSQPKQKSELAKDVEEIKKKMNEMMAVLDELKKAKANCVNHFVEEEYEVNVRFVDEAKGMNMIVNSGAPVSIVTIKWMEKYLKNMQVKKEEITENDIRESLEWGRIFI